MANLNPKRTKRYNQSSLVGTLKGTPPDTARQGMGPSAGILNRRPPDTVFQLNKNPKGEYSAAKKHGQPKP